MRPPFADHPLIQQFNEIKRYFRTYETEVSRHRIRDFRCFARVLLQAGYDVAFDFVGSVNFGVAESESDVDFVLYIRCENDYKGDCDPKKCHTLPQVENLILHTLMKEYVKEPYNTQVIDCINLSQLEIELKKPVLENSVAFRFAFYRSICRGVNLRVLRPFHQALLRNEALIKAMQPELDSVFQGLTRSMPHHLSFEKYRVRLGSSGVHIPVSLMKKIQDHLHYLNRETGDSYCDD
jgi:hypothetical protein